MHIFKALKVLFIVSIIFPSVLFCPPKKGAKRKGETPTAATSVASSSLSASAATSVNSPLNASATISSAKRTKIDKASVISNGAAASSSSSSPVDPDEMFYICRKVNQAVKGPFDYKKSYKLVLFVYEVLLRIQQRAAHMVEAHMKAHPIEDVHRDSGYIIVPDEQVKGLFLAFDYFFNNQMSGLEIAPYATTTKAIREVVLKADANPQNSEYYRMIVEQLVNVPIIKSIRVLNVALLKLIEWYRNSPDYRESLDDFQKNFRSDYRRHNSEPQKFLGWKSDEDALAGVAYEVVRDDGRRHFPVRLRIHSTPHFNRLVLTKRLQGVAWAREGAMDHHFNAIVASREKAIFSALSEKCSVIPYDVLTIISSYLMGAIHSDDFATAQYFTVYVWMKLIKMISDAEELLAEHILVDSDDSQLVGSGSQTQPLSWNG